MTLKEITKEIAAGLSAPPRPLKAILFGSLAHGTPHEDSDIDLVVILDKEGKSGSYKALINNRMEISRKLRKLKKKYPIDVLVYTKDEWEELRASGSSFIEKIENEGITIL
ncbi:MAG: nucleotidyltransferase domain-containing protein [Thermodesulfobacteriota bacterium]